MTHPKQAAARGVSPDLYFPDDALKS